MLTYRIPSILASLLFLVLATVARADGLIVIHNPPNPVPGHFSFAPLEVVYHKVECAIDGQVAITSVDQEFKNPNNAQLEGTYIFPIPKNANINKFAMDIDGKQVEAELLPAEKARKIYEDIVRKAKDPALLEYADQAMFKVRIFPIEPYGKKRVTLKYTELLKTDNNLTHYIYTLNTEKFSAKPLQNVSVKVTIDGKEPLTAVYSPSHDVEVKRQGEFKALVGYEAKDIRPDRDFHLYIGRKAAPVGISVLAYKPDADKDGYFLLLAAPTLSKDVKAQPKDVVFVMDTSGSMSGDKIEQARKALKFCVNSLNPSDRFNIIQFATDANPHFKSLTDATDDNRKKAVTWIDTLKATGGTAINDALQLAIDQKPSDNDRLFIVVFLTDGQPTIGTQDPDHILKKLKARQAADNTRIFSFGVGTDVNTRLLDLMAEQTKGYSQYVLPKEDIEVAMSTFFSKVADPVIAGLKLDTGNIVAGNVYPKNLPDLFKGEQLVAFGTYSKSGNTAVVLTGNVGGQVQKFAQDVTFPDKTDASNEWIAKLWATRRVGYLLDQIRINGESAELKNEVVELARRWGIVTPYTAMLIIEDERTRSVPVASRTLGDLEADTNAVAAASDGMDSLRKKEAAGEQAVANSISTGAYKSADSLEGVARAAEQRDNRYQFAGQKGVALDRSDAPAPVSAPARPGQWVAGTANGSGGAADAKRDLGYRVVTNYAQQNKVVNNRAFYLNGNQWTDARVQKLVAEQRDAKRVKVAFNSEAYFDLLKKHPDAAKYLALGNNVSFEIDGTIYDITEETPEPKAN